MTVAAARHVAARHVFVSLVAQHDNLGDLVIRREMVRWLAQPGVVLHPLVADAPDEFVDAVHLPTDAVVHRSARHWQQALLAHAARGHAGLVFAPGPQGLGGAPRHLAHESVNLLNAMVLRGRHNPVAKIGRSLADGTRGVLPTAAVAIERGVRRLSNEYWLRDAPSAARLRRPIAVLPDISLSTGALDCPPVGGDEAPDVAVSARHDRGWSAAEIAAIAEQAAALGRRVVLVTQVRRDHAGHEALARATGVDHLGWQGEATAGQLARVTAQYARSALVVTDRLHAALFGLVVGATPVPRRTDDAKLRPALATLGLPGGIPAGDDPLAEALAWRALHATQVTAARDAAAASLAEARERLRRLFGGVDG